MAMTYQELLACGENEERRGEFCFQFVGAVKATEDYKNAQVGDAYYKKHNLTIENYQKMLRTASGRMMPDEYSPNYKVKSLVFREMVLLQTGYVLGNGVFFSNENTKKKLGKAFDGAITKAARIAISQGRAYGFWNFDHLEIFGVCETRKSPGFAPIYDENTGEVMAGVRFWTRKRNRKTFEYATLYEVDGVTEYIRTESVITAGAKQPYKQSILTAPALGVVGMSGENYDRLPIVELFSSDTEESELVGLREGIDAYDAIKNGYINAIDDDAVYWLIKNCGGMDDADIAQFLRRLHLNRVAQVEDDGAQVEAKELNLPYEAKEKLLDRIKRDLYRDFMIADVSELSASAKTTQEIRAAFVMQDSKCADFEYQLIDFIDSILAIAGIEDEPTFRWQTITNATEDTTMVVMAAPYVTQECVIRHLPFLTPEEAEAEIAAVATRATAMYEEDEDEQN